MSLLHSGFLLVVTTAAWPPPAARVGQAGAMCTRGRRALRVGLAALVAVSLAAGAACSGAEDGAPDGAASPATSEPVARVPEIVVGGDSVAASLVPALAAALGDRAHVDYLAAATISTASDRLAWRSGVEGYDPDLVVVLTGPWEVLQPGFAPTEPDWPATYARSVLDPLADDLTAGGARVLWIEMHAATKASTTLSFSVLATQVRALADRRDDLDVLDSGEFVDLPGDLPADVLPGPDGAPQRIRRQDGTGVHLCPAGVVRLATPVLRWIAEEAALPDLGAEGWQEASWRWPPELPKPQECPPAPAPATSTP